MIESDANLFLYLNTLFSTPGWSGFFSQVTHLGNGWGQALLVLPGMYFLSRDKFRTHFPAMVITAALGGLLVVGAKEVVRRPRPPAHFAAENVSIHTPQGEPSDYSFPSGHTQTAFSTAGYLSFLFPVLSPIFLLLAALVGVSRVALGVHFPLDVAVGAALGLACAIVGYQINVKRLNRK